MEKRGKKTCPSCSKQQGVRTFICECGYNFKPGHKPKPKQVLKGVGKGKKQCPECEALVGPRTQLCDCGYQFMLSTKKVKTKKPPKVKKRQMVEDWRTLEKGDKIRPLKGYGTYYLGENGEKDFFRDGGTFVVQKLDNNGVIAHGKCGTAHIWMAAPCKGIMGKIHRNPHKLKLIKKVNQDNK